MSYIVEVEMDCEFCGSMIEAGYTDKDGYHENLWCKECGHTHADDSEFAINLGYELENLIDDRDWQETLNSMMGAL